jgi:hypothetical protein
MIDANRWLADRGFGKAALVVAAPERDDVASELSTFSIEELRAIAAALKAAKATPTPDGSILEGVRR